MLHIWVLVKIKITLFRTRNSLGAFSGHFGYEKNGLAKLLPLHYRATALSIACLNKASPGMGLRLLFDSRTIADNRRREQSSLKHPY